MNSDLALILPYPRNRRTTRPVFAAASPRVFSPQRALWLGAECCALKVLLVEQQTKATALEESQREATAQHGRDAAKIAALIARNQELTKALHRTACAG